MRVPDTKEDEHDHGGFGIGEGYITWFQLPGHTSLTVGKKRQQFGVLNRWHRHALDQSDWPWVIQESFGPAGLVGTGVSVDWLMPRMWADTNELTVEIMNGNNDVAFAGSDWKKPTFLAYLKNYWDLSAPGSDVTKNRQAAKRRQIRSPGLFSALGLTAEVVGAVLVSVLNAGPEEGPEVVIRQAVIDRAAFAVGLQQRAVAEQAELVADGGDRQTGVVRQVGDIEPLMLGQRIHDADPGGIGDRREEPAEALHDPIWKRLRFR